MAEANDWNSKIISEFRANGGKVGGQFEGAPLLLLHTVGAKSGQDRVNPMMYRATGDSFAVFASKAGAPTNPDWYPTWLPIPGCARRLAPRPLRSPPGWRMTTNGIGSGPRRSVTTQVSRTTRPKRHGRSQSSSSNPSASFTAHGKPRRVEDADHAAAAVPDQFLTPAPTGRARHARHAVGVAARATSPRGHAGCASGPDIGPDMRA